MIDLICCFVFLNEVDRLKLVDCVNVLMDLLCVENSVEYSWYVVLYVLVFGGLDWVLVMILLYELVEIDIGDYLIYLDYDLFVVVVVEQVVVWWLFVMLFDGVLFLVLWQEFEVGEIDDVCFVKCVDYIQLLFQVLSVFEFLFEYLQVVCDNLVKGCVVWLCDEWFDVIKVVQVLLDGQFVLFGMVGLLVFLVEVDWLKFVYCVSEFCDVLCKENSVEYSWYLVFYVLIMLFFVMVEVQIGCVICMLILYDLVEIDIGDVLIYVQGGVVYYSVGQMVVEDVVVDCLFGMLFVVLGQDLCVLWVEFEVNESVDVVFVKLLDCVQLVMQNIVLGGGLWVVYDVIYD